MLWPDRTNPHTQTHNKKKVNIQHDTTDCFVVGLHVFLAHEFSLIYYTLTCFDGRARNGEKLANGERKKCPSACMCVCVCVCVSVSDDR
jgi:hypothetical protein